MASQPAPAKGDDVLVVREIWDVPLSGVTMFEGGFYSFQRIYDEEAQGWPQSREFLMQQLTGVELAQFNEVHQIFSAWLEGYQKGSGAPHPLTPDASGPAAERYKHLHQLTEAILFAETERTIRCTGDITLHADKTRYVAHWQRLI